MKIFAVIFAAALTICGSAFASATDTINVHFDNPVVVGTTTLPAGNVSIQILHGSNRAILTARSESGVVAAVVVSPISDLGEKESHANIVLGRRGETLT